MQEFFQYTKRINLLGYLFYENFIINYLDIFIAPLCIFHLCSTFNLRSFFLSIFFFLHDFFFRTEKLKTKKTKRYFLLVVTNAFFWLYWNILIGDHHEPYKDWAFCTISSSSNDLILSKIAHKYVLHLFTWLCFADIRNLRHHGNEHLQKAFDILLDITRPPTVFILPEEM